MSIGKGDDGYEPESEERARVAATLDTAAGGGARPSGFLLFVEARAEPDMEPVRELDAGNLGENSSADERRNVLASHIHGASGREPLTPYDFGVPRPEAARIRSPEDERVRQHASNTVGPGRVFAGNELDPLDAKAPQFGKAASPRHLSYAAPLAGSRARAAASSGHAGEHEPARPAYDRERTQKQAAQVIAMMVLAVNVLVFGVQFAFLQSQFQRVEESELALKEATRQLAEMTEAVRLRNSSGDALLRERPSNDLDDSRREVTSVSEHSARLEADMATFGALEPAPLAGSLSRGLTRGITAPPADPALPTVPAVPADPASEAGTASGPLATLDRGEGTKMPVLPDTAATPPLVPATGRSCRGPTTQVAAGDQAAKPRGAPKVVRHRRNEDGSRAVVARARPETGPRVAATSEPPCEPVP